MYLHLVPKSFTSLSNPSIRIGGGLKHSVVGLSVRKRAKIANTRNVQLQFSRFYGSPPRPQGSISVDGNEFEAKRSLSGRGSL